VLGIFHQSDSAVPGRRSGSVAKVMRNMLLAAASIAASIVMVASSLHAESSQDRMPSQEELPTTMNCSYPWPATR
jgi:hypothetical protein